MPDTLERRVDELEKQVADLVVVVGAKPRKKDWEATVGTWIDDEVSRQADGRGREYRDSLRNASDRAGA